MNSIKSTYKYCAIDEHDEMELYMVCLSSLCLDKFLLCGKCVLSGIHDDHKDSIRSLKEYLKQMQENKDENKLHVINKQEMIKLNFNRLRSKLVDFRDSLNNKINSLESIITESESSFLAKISYDSFELEEFLQVSSSEQSNYFNILQNFIRFSSIIKGKLIFDIKKSSEINNFPHFIKNISDIFSKETSSILTSLNSMFSYVDYSNNIVGSIINCFHPIYKSWDISLTNANTLAKKIYGFDPGYIMIDYELGRKEDTIWAFKIISLKCGIEIGLGFRDLLKDLENSFMMNSISYSTLGTLFSKTNNSTIDRINFPKAKTGDIIIFKYINSKEMLYMFLNNKRLFKIKVNFISNKLCPTVILGGSGDEVQLLFFDDNIENLKNKYF